MDRNENILAYTEVLKKENEELKRYIKTLEEQIALYKSKDGSESWIHLKAFKESMAEVREIKQELLKEIKETKKIKQEYRKKLDEMIQQY